MTDQTSNLQAEYLMTSGDGTPIFQAQAAEDDTSLSVQPQASTNAMAIIQTPETTETGTGDTTLIQNQEIDADEETDHDSSGNMTDQTSNLQVEYLMTSGNLWNVDVIWNETNATVSSLSHDAIGSQEHTCGMVEQLTNSFDNIYQKGSTCTEEDPDRVSDSSGSEVLQFSPPVQNESKVSDFPNVTVPQYEGKSNGKRNYTKRQACYVCKKLQSKSARHLEVVHHKDPDVARALAKSGLGKSNAMEKLRLIGNFNHNIDVLHSAKGELLVLRRPAGHKIAEEYLPCIYCYGFLETHEIWRHTKECKMRPSDGIEIEQGKVGEEDDDNSGVPMKTRCHMLLKGAAISAMSKSDQFMQLRTDVLSKMREDPVKKIILEDELIQMFGSALLSKIGKAKRQSISQKMRQLGRLVQQMREETRDNASAYLTNWISGQSFDTVVKATRSLCSVTEKSTSSGVPMLESPSLGLHLGHSLSKCAMIKQGMGIRNNDSRAKDEAAAFSELFGNEWTEKVSSPSLQTLRERKYTQDELLPMTSDLLKLKEFASKEMATALKKLEELANPYNWIRLAIVLFVIVTLFNKRRGGEVAKMNVSCYVNRPNWKEIRNEEIKKTLTELELKLLEKYVFYCDFKILE